MSTPVRSLQRGRVAFLGCVAALACSSCDAILGIEEVTLDPSGSGASTTTGGGGGGGNGAGAMGGGGNGGTGGAVNTGDFAFGVKTVNVLLPRGGSALVDVEIVPDGEFDEPVDVSLKLTPSGVTFQGTTLPSGIAAGRVTVGATNALAIGDQVSLTFVASSGELVHEQTVMARVTGAPGSLVDTFGLGGVGSWTAAMDDTNVFDVREVAEGKIVVGGNATPGLATLLKGARLLPTGAMDNPFGTSSDGTIAMQFCSCTQPSEARTVLREVGGRVLLIGSGSQGGGASDDIAVGRLRDDGTLDNVGGDNGKALIDLGGADYGGAAAFSQTGALMVLASRDAQLVFAKLSSDWSSLDPSYGSSGTVAFPPGQLGNPRDLLLAPNGDLVALSAIAGPQMLIARVNDDGGATSFGGGDGFLTVTAGMGLDPKSVGLDSLGRIVVAATITTASGLDIYVARYLSDGTVDSAFGTNGESVLSLPGDQQAGDLVVLDDDRVVVVGGALANPIMARWLQDGTLDPTFGNMGFSPLVLGINSAAQTMTKAIDGQVFVAGYRESQPAKGFVAKVWQ